jgi:uncharacterized membrane protein YhaH (DUF805 family)
MSKSVKIISLFSFEGRISRRDYFVSLFILFLLIYFLDNIPKDSSIFLRAVCYGIILWLLLSQGAKRCHDIGISGWWQIIPFYIITLIFYRGDGFKNQYGQSPKAKNEDQHIH